MFINNFNSNKKIIGEIKMNRQDYKILSELYDQIYEQAVEDTVDYLEEGGDYYELLESGKARKVFDVGRNLATSALGKARSAPGKVYGAAKKTPGKVYGAAKATPGKVKSGGKAVLDAARSEKGKQAGIGVGGVLAGGAGGRYSEGKRGQAALSSEKSKSARQAERDAERAAELKREIERLKDRGLWDRIRNL